MKVKDPGAEKNFFLIHPLTYAHALAHLKLAADPPPYHPSWIEHVKLIRHVVEVLETYKLKAASGGWIKMEAFVTDATVEALGYAVMSFRRWNWFIDAEDAEFCATLFKPASNPTEEAEDDELEDEIEDELDFDESMLE